jgi:xanthine dehydrogenase accessory factor
MKQAEFATVVSDLVGKGEPFVVATVTKTEGGTLGKPGFKVIISGTGQVLHGTLGGGCPESAIVPAARKTMTTGTSKTVKVFLENTEAAVAAVVSSRNEDEIHVETNCGGTMEIYLEPYLPTERLIVIGQGGKDDVEDALVRYGKVLDYEVVVIDHSPVLTEQPDRLLANLSNFDFSASDSVVVLTTGERDFETLVRLSKFKLRYVGMRASRQRASDNLARLRDNGVDEEFVLSLRTPAGGDIGALTPAEIALSIMAEIVAAKHGKTLPRKAPLADPRIQQPNA